MLLSKELCKFTEPMVDEAKKAVGKLSCVFYGNFASVINKWEGVGKQVYEKAKKQARKELGITAEVFAIMECPCYEMREGERVHYVMAAGTHKIKSKFCIAVEIPFDPIDTEVDKSRPPEGI